MITVKSALKLGALLDMSNFDIIDPGFSSENTFSWMNVGNGVVRGEFHTFRMEKALWDYSTRRHDLSYALAQESAKIGRQLAYATAYELLYYVTHGWDGASWVIAYGSIFCDVETGLDRVAVLKYENRDRKITLSWQHTEWRDERLALCVIL